MARSRVISRPVYALILSACTGRLRPGGPGHAGSCCRGRTEAAQAGYAAMLMKRTVTYAVRAVELVGFGVKAIRPVPSQGTVQPVGSALPT